MFSGGIALREAPIKPDGWCGRFGPDLSGALGNRYRLVAGLRSKHPRVSSHVAPRTSNAKALSRAPRRFDLDFGSPAITEAAAMGQLAYYDRLQKQRHITLVRNRADLDAAWSDPTGPIGCILSMEGCDPIVEPADARTWWQRGCVPRACHTMDKDDMHLAQAVMGL